MESRRTEKSGKEYQGAPAEATGIWTLPGIRETAASKNKRVDEGRRNVGMNPMANQNSVLDLSGPNSTLPERAAPPIGLRLTLQEVSALEAAISSSTMSHWGWKVDAAGRVTAESGQVVFRAGFASAIRKTVDHVADF
ncbi:gamma-mobile-trio protein GmtX [Paraburkholderia sp. BL23I1N1]|uniref:gamma-mobile-trio protein GmtX n=1 Tax=Paraburkholderia sp. BL23I1N1 TaxID=1938802 RepID=UPI0011C48997|nr:gamma-mobile-trio protein GmtX [Paraburkholderia sp. BL23I1N1]